VSPDEDDDRDHDKDAQATTCCRGIRPKRLGGREDQLPSSLAFPNSLVNPSPPRQSGRSGAAYLSEMAVSCELCRLCLARSEKEGQRMAGLDNGCQAMARRSGAAACVPATQCGTNWCIVSREDPSREDPEDSPKEGVFSLDRALMGDPI